MLTNTQAPKNREKTNSAVQSTSPRNRKSPSMTAANGNGNGNGHGSPSAVAAIKSMPTHDEIAARATQIYLKKGRPAGRDLENWLEAEMELKRERDLAKR